MRRQPDLTQPETCFYEQIGHRVHQIISDPNVQKRQFVIVTRLPWESLADWRRLLDDMAGTLGVQMDEMEDDAVRIGWREYCEA